MSYSEKLIDHYENPRNIGSLDKNSEDVGTGLVGAPACGDVMKLQIKVGADGLIEDAKFKTFGCGSAIASTSLVTEWVKGKTIDEAETIKNTDIAKHLALPPVKIHCSVLAEDAIKAAIADYRAKIAKKDESDQGRRGVTADMSTTHTHRDRCPPSRPRAPRPRRPRPQVMTVTPAAAERAKALIEGRGKPTAGIRIGVRTKGCSGLSYTLEFADKQEPMDEVVETQGIKLLIDPKASLFLIGTEMDYEEEKLKSGLRLQEPQREGPLRLRRILPRLKSVRHGSFRAAGTAGGARHRTPPRSTRPTSPASASGIPTASSASPPSERARASVEAAALNDAYRTLKDPLARAVYLAELKGVELPGDGKTIDDPELLMEVMDAREELHEASSVAEVDALAAFAREDLQKALADAAAFVLGKRQARHQKGAPSPALPRQVRR